MNMKSKELRLKIELVPSTSWYNNLRKYITKEDWDKIRKTAGTIEKSSDFLICHPSYPTFSSCLQ
ncbi:hypothetical protein C5S35_02845, partial [Candidatus Methanophagaceae archaeon]